MSDTPVLEMRDVRRTFLLGAGMFRSRRALRAVNGVSLTVAKVAGNKVTLAIIPHTMEMTNLGSLQPGDPLNIETDIIAKYVEKMLGEERVLGAISLERLVSEGF